VAHTTRCLAVTVLEPRYLDGGQAVYCVAVWQAADAQLQPDVAARTHAFRDAVQHQPIGQHSLYPARPVAASVT
jgi:hypothetical protein